jgi:hypothetical protein
MPTNTNKNERSKFKRRKQRLFERTDEFGKLFNADMYTLVQNRPELQGSSKCCISIYSSLPDNTGWPLSRSELVRRLIQGIFLD